MAAQQPAPLVVMVMGSSSDWEVIHHAADMLTQFDIPFGVQVVSAYRMPGNMFGYTEAARSQSLRAIITGAGEAAHLPGMITTKTIVPTLDVPAPSRYLRGKDSLLPAVQIPEGIPVSTFVIGEASATNTALVTIVIIATAGSALADKLEAFRAQQTEVIRGTTLLIRDA